MSEYYFVSLDGEESISPIDDLSALERFWGKYKDALGNGGDEYLDAIADECGDLKLRDALYSARKLYLALVEARAPIPAGLIDGAMDLRLDIESEVLDAVKSTCTSFSNLCMRALKRDGRFTDDWISYARGTKAIVHDALTDSFPIFFARYPKTDSVNADDMAQLWADGALPKKLIEDFENAGIELDKSGKMVYHN